LRWLFPTRTFRILAGLVLLAFAFPSPARNLAQNKQLAREQFQRAEQLREALNARPLQERSRRDYQQLTEAYRRVYYLSPTSTKADAAVVAVAELLAEAGRRFDEPKTLQAAIGQYEFLRREYPGSRYRVDALFTIAQIYKSDLNDTAQAKQAYQEFLKRYPQSRLAEKAKTALAELAKPPQSPEKKKKELQVREAASAPASKPEPGTAPASRNGVSLVTGIRYWSTPDYTRVAIDLESEVQYQAGRVPNPDRIFFDLHETRLSATLAGKSFEVQDGLLRKIRVAQFLKGITRVVLDVDDLADYSAFLLPNPYRLIIDIHGRQTRATRLASSPEAPKQTTNEPAVAAKTEPAKVSSGAIPDAKHATEPAIAARPGRVSPPLALKVADGTQAPLKPELDELARARTIRLSESQSASAPASAFSQVPTGSKGETAALKPRVPVVAKTQPSKTTAPGMSRTTYSAEAAVGRSEPTPLGRSDEGKATPEVAISKPSPGHSSKLKRTQVEEDQPEAVMVAHLDPPELKTSKPTSSPTFEAVAPRATLPASAARARSVREAEPGKRRAEDELAVREARPTANGERSLIRTLGLKIGRIVVDAGHGGHDTGTIGPNGLQEKDLVLDVALRLGKLLQSKLGAEVIYTRDDDTFVPLETRTAIANQNEADLFISIHANSSSDPAARGVETYYLNFTSSPEALQVAARENAVSEKSIHELQDLVKKIALKEKIEESREFATDVQKSLWGGMAAKSPAIRNRGVKKAPFIVLIGANMPSILAEISFVSNPTDERRLQTPEYRQKVAEYLYRGIARYANGLSGVKVAQQR
jgi:N-acetylmuramoyl-L-alanine amidase